MPTFDRRSVIVSGSALLTTGVFATVGSGSAENDTENSSDAGTDGETEIVTESTFNAEPSDGWYSFYANSGSTRAVSAANEPSALEGVAWSYGNVEANDGIAISDGRVYRHDGNDRIHALDAETGSLQWVSPDIGADDGPNLAPVVVGDWVFVGGEALTALDADTGAVRWRQWFGEGEEAPSVYQPEFANGLLYVCGDDDERLYAVNPDDGSIAWERHSIDEIDEGDSLLGRFDTFHAYSLAVTDDAVYATVGIDGDTAHVVALDPETGDTLWVSETGWMWQMRPVATDQYVLIHDGNSREVLLLDPETGETVGSVSSRRSTFAADDVLAFATIGEDQTLRMTNLDTGSDGSSERWSVDEMRLYSDPVVVGETVIAITADWNGNEFLKGYRVEDGSEAWCLHLEDVPQFEDDHRVLRDHLAVSDGTVYLGGEDGLFAVR
ncbi:PQQ-binding-like beta-propeller repeat protein [Natronosalvus rutilus]|uniref:PQQ-binding-like beta-propeller repeat protein n=1 Tax=Natronosalvus rutilus TaxID=2953753 RepID=A0A9E7NBD8_9EURY|nr:PQQ-binding-like beta-propeller repeat protein [Natronosalvus rutilus]UTF53858.1 PQQ-binding-like beta-propeller repeat protein [Natronosalvus rutilus]